jgi:hypothetical protein
MGGAVGGSAGLMFIIHQNELLADFGILQADPARKTGLRRSGLANRHVRGQFAVEQLEQFCETVVIERTDLESHGGLLPDSM